MPDLNYRNPDVTAQVQKITSYWLNDIGIDGFRLDAAKHLIEADAKIENTPATHDWLKNFYTYYKAAKPGSFVVGEVFGAGGFIAKTYTNQLDEVFNFELSSGFVNSANGNSNTGINSAIKLTLPKMPDGQYATFLTNHDQNRAMSLFAGNTDKAKVAAALMLTAPGTPFIYYGEEIGMKGQKPDEDIRLPMQWTTDPVSAGFTKGTPWRAPGTNTITNNVALQENDPSSLLQYYKSLIKLRNAHPALQTGSWTLVQTSITNIYASLRIEGSESILVLVNLGKDKVTDYSLSWENSPLPDRNYQVDTIFGSESVQPLNIKAGRLESYQPLPVLDPYSTNIFSLK